MFTNIHDILLLLYNDKEKNIDENINNDDLEAGLYSDDEAGLYSDGEDVTKLLIDDEKTRFIESKEETVLKNTMDESVINQGHKKRGRKRKEEGKNIAITQPPKKRGRKPNEFKSADQEKILSDKIGKPNYQSSLSEDDDEKK